MFENVGTKLKVLANIIAILGIIGSIVCGLYLVKESVLIGILTMVCGSIGSWVTALIIYGIGEAADNSRGSALSPQPKRRLAPSTTKLPKTPMAPLTVRDSKRCPHCGDTVRSKICDMCGQENDLF